MRCMFCNCPESKVIDSRPVDDNNSICRRRECIRCGRRFTTYEKTEHVPLMIIKRDGSREPFDDEKLRAGIMRACEKLPVSTEEISSIVRAIEQDVYRMDKEVTTSQIGDKVMAALHKLNDVAYVRFAAVYHKFTDLTAFMTEVQRLVDEQEELPQE